MKISEIVLVIVFVASASYVALQWWNQHEQYECLKAQELTQDGAVLSQPEWFIDQCKAWNIEI